MNPAANNNTPLFNAIRQGDNDIVEIFLDEAKVNPTLPNNEPLLNAIKNSNVELVQILNLEQIIKEQSLKLVLEKALLKRERKYEVRGFIFE